MAGILLHMCIREHASMASKPYYKLHHQLQIPDAAGVYSCLLQVSENCRITLPGLTQNMTTTPIQ